MNPADPNAALLAYRRQREARLELGLVLGGTLGIASVMLLRFAGRERDANMLSFLGVLAGGVVGALRVVNRFD